MSPSYQCWWVATVFLCEILCLLSEVAQGQGDTLDTAKYQLVWSDEFNESGPPNDSNWSYERGFVRNEELQWYQPENATCENGLLVIEARRERVPNPRYQANSRDWKTKREAAEYTSACLHTRGKQEWKYGKFVMRAKLDTRPGLWPAFWTLGTRRPWPACGEIDVMEYYDGKILANVAWLGDRRRPARDTTHSSLNRWDRSWSDRFHVWQLVWTAEKIQILLDDEVLNETPLATTTNHDRTRSNPFHEPHYILLNLAIGGTQGGDPSPTAFPARYEIDFVRVYQLGAEGQGSR